MNTVDQYKSQAERLGKHLLAKYGLKLRHSATLEALALTYGKRDWNELSAGAAPGPEKVKRGTTSATSDVSELLLQLWSNGAGMVYFQEATEHAEANVKYRKHGGKLQQHDLAPAKVQAYIDELSRECRFSGVGTEEAVIAIGPHQSNANVVTLPVHGGRMLLARLKPSDQPRLLSELGLPNVGQFRDVLNYATEGLVLVTGPCGSGMSTTLAACVAHLKSEGRSTLWLSREEASWLLSTYGVQGTVERLMKGTERCVVVEEIISEETAELAFRLAENGRLVLSRLYTSSVRGAFLRLQDLEISTERSTRVMRGVLLQRLGRRPCGRCGGTGCAECGDGVIGRTLISELAVFRNQEAVQAAMQGHIRWMTLLENSKRAEHSLGTLLAGETRRLFGDE